MTAEEKKIKRKQYLANLPEEEKRRRMDNRNKRARTKRVERTKEEKEIDSIKRHEQYCNLSKETLRLTNQIKYTAMKSDKGKLAKHKDRTSKYMKQYNKDNKEKLNRYNKQWHKTKLETDEIYKAKVKTRAMIKDAMRRMGYSKTATATKILGCSFENFQHYLEAQFEPWMNWNNYGKYNGEFNYGWDIDHVIPLSSGTTIEEVHQLNHHTNLRPLCSKINRDIKRNRV